MAGKGLGQRVRQLKDELSKRKWGEEGEVRASVSDRAAGKNVAGQPRNGEGSKPKTKRLGKKQRARLGKTVEGGVEGAPMPSHMGPEPPSQTLGKRKADVETMSAGPVGDDGEKKKRKKKKKGAAVV
jgi:protein KRI1